MKRLIGLGLVMLLAACSNLQLTPSGNLTPLGDLADKVVAGNLKAADYADANGYPERAAVRRALAAQITACKKAIQASVPRAPAGDTDPILLAEMLEEAVGQGVPARVKITCMPIPIPSLP